VTNFQLLRVKTNPTVVDDDWVGTNVVPDASICTRMQSKAVGDMPMTGIEFYVIGTDAAGAPIARAASAFDATLIEVTPRNVGVNSDPAWAVAVVESQTQTSLQPQEVYFFELNGASLFTIRISNNATVDAAINRLQIWWKPVVR